MQILFRIKSCSIRYTLFCAVPFLDGGVHQHGKLFLFREVYNINDPLSIRLSGSVCRKPLLLNHIV